MLYQLRPEAGFVLGLDVGREYVRGAIADLSGVVRARSQRKVHPTSSAGRVSELVTLADELVATVKIKRSAVTQTVIGSPGIYDRRRDAFFMARGLPGWQRPQVLAELRRAFGEDMVVENDVNLAALAERDVGTAARREELRIRDGWNGNWPGSHHRRKTASRLTRGCGRDCLHDARKRRRRGPERCAASWLA